MSLIYAIQRHINKTTTATDTQLMVTLRPEPSQTPPIPPIININPIQSEAAFSRRGSRSTKQPTYNSVGYILAVSINGHSYNGSIFDANRTLLA